MPGASVPQTAVKNRTRFDVFHRDNYTCRYCGKAAPHVILAVDHVVPRVLGGSDDPTNLVTACWDCNTAKGRRSPDMPPVEQVSADTFRWAAAMKAAAEALVAEYHLITADVDAVFEQWVAVQVGVPDDDYSVWPPKAAITEVTSVIA